MAENTTVHVGAMNRRVEVYRYGSGRNEAGEHIQNQLTSLGRFWAMRKDLSGGEDSDGKLVSFGRVEFITRHTETLMNEGADMMIRDVDGDYFVTYVGLYGSERQRKRLIRLRAEMRDE